MVGKIAIADLSLNRDKRTDDPAAVDLELGYYASISVDLGVGEGQTTLVRFMGQEVEGLPLDPIGVGEAVEVSLTLPTTLGEVSIATGESIVEFRRDVKDPRLSPAVLVATPPFNYGWTFLSSAQGSWPAGYTQSGVWHHFYAIGEGMSISFPRWQVLVTPSYQLSEVFGPNNGLYPVYSTTPGAILAFTGETLVASVRLEFVSVGSTARSGETFLPGLATDRQLTAGAHYGECFTFNLELLGIPMLVGVGESVLLSLDVYDLVGNTARTGESLAVTLSTTAVFPAPSMATGEALVGTLDTRPYATISSPQHTGATLSASMSAIPRMDTTLSAGEALTAALTLPERSSLVISAYEGQAFALPTLSTAISLGTVSVFEGWAVTVVEMATLSNYRAADGVSLSVSFESSPNFAPHGHEGATLSATLDTRPPATISARFYDGSYFEGSTLATIVASTFRVTFCEGVFIEVSESTSTTYYDLEGPPSYPNRLEWWLDMNQFEFLDMPPSFSWGSGVGTLVTVSLQTRPRFSIGFATGESFVMDRGYDYMDVEVLAGDAGRSQTFLYIEPHINLCYPNVFPNTDAMEVELDFSEEDCYADFIYDGQVMAAKLSCQHTVAPVWWHEGTRMDFDLTIYDLWRVRFWSGERLDFYLGIHPVFAGSCYTGESMKATFEEPSVLMYTGENVEVTLTNTFDVEFLERGCLDNEYRYMTKNGDEDKEKFNPVAVELEPFSHEIKARCF